MLMLLIITITQNCYCLSDHAQDAHSKDKELTFSVLQGSCARPVLYLAYAKSTMQEIIPETIDVHGYADDHALKRSFNVSSRTQEADVISSLESSLVAIKNYEQIKDE